MNIVLMASIGRGIPVTDEKNKPIIVKRKVKGIDRDIPLHEHAFHRASEIVDLPEKDAKELIEMGKARLPDPALDADPLD